MTHLTEEERDFLEDKFEQFKLDFWKRFKIPAIGLAVVFAGLISVFATYLYMQAKVNVMDAQAELAKAKVTFYEGMMKANKEINTMTEEFNNLVGQAGVSVEKMKDYEDELRIIIKKHNKLKRSAHPRPSLKKTETTPKSIKGDSKTTEKQKKRSLNRSKDMFNIQQQRIK